MILILFVWLLLGVLGVALCRLAWRRYFYGDMRGYPYVADVVCLFLGPVGLIVGLLNYYSWRR